MNPASNTAPATKSVKIKSKVVVVDITTKPRVGVTIDPVEITADDEVRWECTEPFEVTFRGQPEGSPFARDTFTHANPRSGKPVQTTPNRRYKYVVKVKGHPPLDPEVIIVARL